MISCILPIQKYTDKYLDVYSNWISYIKSRVRLSKKLKVFLYNWTTISFMMKINYQNIEIKIYQSNNTNSRKIYWISYIEIYHIYEFNNYICVIHGYNLILYQKDIILKLWYTKPKSRYTTKNGNFSEYIRNISKKYFLRCKYQK